MEQGMTQKKKVVVGMSGGVDSSVAAYLLKEQGYEVYGATMRTWDQSPDLQGTTDVSGSLEATKDAEQIAKALDIPYHVIDFRTEFQCHVMDYFVKEYLEGRTPNPCIVCNRHVKWASLMQYAKEIGADYVATGHYARIDCLDNGRYALKMSATATKDQTYALYNLTQEQLKHTLMPVGEYTKEEIREIAAKISLEVANKSDSMEICFIPDNDYAGYIERVSGTRILPGNYVDKSGTILGKHKGIVHYTIGQRKGLNLSMGKPVFVTEIRPETNEVVIGDNEDIFCNTLVANQVNFMGVAQVEEDVVYTAKIRYSHKPVPCKVKQIGADEIQCIFETPVRAITPGQAVVVYKGEYVAFGGIITG
jgi:tRNA-specific 2-thiouridylase